MMRLKLHDPFDPAEFGDVFAESISKLADEPQEVDLDYGTHDVQFTITMQGIDYLVRVVPAGLEDQE